MSENKAQEWVNQAIANVQVTGSSEEALQERLNALGENPTQEALAEAYFPAEEMPGIEHDFKLMNAVCFVTMRLGLPHRTNLLVLIVNRFDLLEPGHIDIVQPFDYIGPIHLRTVIQGMVKAGDLDTYPEIPDALLPYTQEDADLRDCPTVMDAYGKEEGGA